MRAAVIRQYGSPDVFSVEEVPRQGQLRPQDVRIDVHASSVNPVDWKIRSGGQRSVIRLKWPSILGLDVSGIVSEVGARVTKFKVGDAVYASPTHRRPGCYAEETVIDESALAHKPDRLSHEEAAAFPLVALTAWKALVLSGGLKADQRVLVQAGSGGVGTVAIQLAKALGAHVITTCSERNFELVKSLGADEVINYREQDFSEVLSDLDLVLDSVGGEAATLALKTLKRGGRLSSIVAGLPTNTKKYGPVLGLIATAFGLGGFMLKASLKYGVRARNVMKESSGAQLTALSELVEAGKITPIVDQIFSLDDIAEAHRYSESGRARGKIVIKVR